MAGPWRNPKNGIWYFRKATPTDVLRERERLEALGIKVRRETQRSLHTRNRNEADRRYKVASTEVEDMWDQWRSLLREQVTPTHREALAMAGADAKVYLAAHSDEPGEAVDGRLLVDAVWRNVEFAFPRDHRALAALRQEIAAVPFPQTQAKVHAMLEAEPDGARRVLLKGFEQMLTGYLDVLGWGRAPLVARSHGKTLTLAGRGKLAKQITAYRRRALDSLAARLDGDYSEPGWVANLKTVEAASASSLTFAAIIDERERKARAGSGRKVSEATLKKYRRITREFEAFRGSGVASTVTRKELEAWMEALKNHVNTRRDKLCVVRDVLGWANQQTDGALLAGGNPFKHLQLPQKVRGDSGAKTYSVAQAQAVLRAARLEVVPKLRWVPWILAYTGMRVSEVRQLEKEDVIESGGRSFLYLRVGLVRGVERTTKNGRERKVPLHSALAAERFLDFVAKAPNGPLFPVKRLQQDLGEWVHQVLKDAESIPAPNHGFRHLFEDFLRAGYGVSYRAGCYITGRSSGGSEEDYGKGEAVLRGLAAEMDKLPDILEIRL
jgi:integrase